MNKAISMIVAALALAACGQSARLGSLGRNDTVVTNLAPAYAYVDGATNDLAASIGPGDIISDGTNTIDAARNVYGPFVGTNDNTWTYATIPAGYDRDSLLRLGLTVEWDADDSYPDVGGWYVVNGGLRFGRDPAAVRFEYDGFDYEYSRQVHVVATRQLHNIGKLAMTNELPNVPSWAMAADKPTYTAGEVGAATHGDATNAATWAANRAAVAATNYTDAATNALAQAIGGGGGMPEWRQEVIHASMESVFFVTNGWMDVDVDDDIYVRTAGWPSGAAMFVRCHVTSDYAVMPPIRLVGYGTWPTNDFQSVWWRSGTNIFVNVLIEE